MLHSLIKGGEAEFHKSFWGNLSALYAHISPKANQINTCRQLL
ncbi:hypothetical protein PSE_4721 [Pseudovibrio sp. FO-BEG1]|nr:hypothetical protein PSE_4721 [Pseudovibrio sp. FO-BEG1]EEA93180.1 hypothetical protein PJE062_2330 [Pseudovibrio sp. JE062]